MIICYEYINFISLQVLDLLSYVYVFYDIYDVNGDYYLGL